MSRFVNFSLSISLNCWVRITRVLSGSLMKISRMSMSLVSDLPFAVDP